MNSPTRAIGQETGSSASTDQLDDLTAARLVSRFQNGDVEAFVLLYELFQARLQRYLESRLGSKHDAEDVSQQVFLKVFQALPAYRVERRPFRHWLFRVAHNAAEDHRRKAHRVDPADAADLASVQELLPEPPGWGSSPVVHDALGRLPEVQQRVLVLIYRWNMSVREVGLVLGRKEPAVRKLHSRALAALHGDLCAVG